MFSVLLAKCLLFSARRYVMQVHKPVNYTTENNYISNNRKFCCIISVRLLKSKKEPQTMEFAGETMKFIAQNFK